MKKLISADDFGLNKKVNLTIINLYILSFISHLLFYDKKKDLYISPTLSYI